MVRNIKIRKVVEADLGLLAELEVKTWSPLSIPALTYSELTEWYEGGSPFFLVACANEVPCGYYYGILTTFDLETQDEFFRSRGSPLWKPPPHDSRGTSLYGVNIISNMRGAGTALYGSVREACRRMRLVFSVGVSRMPGLDRYLTENPGAELYDPDEVALWYALRNGELLGMRNWSVCPPLPQIVLPPLSAPDPVLATHAKGGHFGITGIQRQYIEPDPESRGYGVRIVSAYPHRHI